MWGGGSTLAFARRFLKECAWPFASAPDGPADEMGSRSSEPADGPAGSKTAPAISNGGGAAGLPSGPAPPSGNDVGSEMAS